MVLLLGHVDIGFLEPLPVSAGRFQGFPTDLASQKDSAAYEERFPEASAMKNLNMA